VSRPRNGFRNENNSPDLAIATRAASQWGVLDVEDLAACGLSRPAIKRRCERGTLHRIHRGVYSVSAPPLSMQARFLAATKATKGTLSHYSAAVLWRLVDYDPNGPVHVTVTTSHTRTVPGVIVHRTRKPPQTIRLDAIPVTTPARALIDLSSMLSFKPLRRAVREGFARKRVTLSELVGQTRQLDEALAQGYVPTESELEDAVHDLLRAHFEPPHVQPTLVLDGIPTRPDFRYPAHKLSIEADGSAFHEHEIARQDDAAKQARLEAAGDRVLRITWQQVTGQPGQTITRLRAAGAPTRSTAAQ
jgi:very-short-patch-repair endonuclease